MADVKKMNNPVIGFSDLSDDTILNYESTFGAHHYSRQQLVVRKAEDIWLHDQNGKKYLDCLAAYSAANQGHHHPRIVKAAGQRPTG